MSDATTPAHRKDDGQRYTKRRSHQPPPGLQSKRTPTSAFNLEKYLNQPVALKLGGKYVTGILRGYDRFLNIVLDDAEEFIKKNDQEFKKQLGRTICRGQMVTVFNPLDGSAEIDNPFSTETDNIIS